ncbi:MAG: hypothetical protein B6D41_00885 [Chloroflexi bacterium UTCFX4]|jgi:hypothetical protein|nr:MAG: hypothetical protein B6D41_00885 [Chloroflexi bacterium UTCFX4]
MPILLLIPFIATIIYLFLPQHILSSSGSRATWFVRSFVFFNALAFWVGSDPLLGNFLNPVLQLALRVFFLETCYVFAIAALHTVKGWRMPRIVTAAIIGFYGIWLFVFLALVQTPLPSFANTDATLEYTLPAFILLRIAAATSTLFLLAELTRCLYRIWQGDQFLAGRLRFCFFTTGAALAFLNRFFVFAHIGAVIGSSEWSGVMLAIEKNLNFAATLFFVLGCLPPGIMKRFARVVLYLDQQRAILELALLRAALFHLTAPLPWPLPNWRTRLDQPAFVLYSSMIDVLDRLSLLESLPPSATIHLEGVEVIHTLLAPDELLERLRHMARRHWLKQCGIRLRRLLNPFARESTTARAG